MTERRSSLTKQIRLYMAEIAKEKAEARSLPEGEIAERMAILNTEARVFMLTRIEQVLLGDQDALLEEATEMADSPLADSDIASLKKRRIDVRKRAARTDIRNIDPASRDRILQEERAKLGLLST